MIRKIAEGKSLTEEELEKLEGYLRYGVWEDLTRYEIHRLRGRDEGPEYLREFWGLKDLSVREIDRVRDFIHRLILQNPPEGAKIEEHFENPALELAAVEVASVGGWEEPGEEFSCWAEVSKERLRTGCQDTMEAILSVAPSREPGVYEVKYSGTLPFNVYDVSPVRGYEVEDGKIMIEVDTRKLRREGVEDAKEILEDILSSACREYDIEERRGSLVAECSPFEDLGDPEEVAVDLAAALSQDLSRVKAHELPREAIFGERLKDVLEDVKCDVLNALHIRHYYRYLEESPAGRDQLVVTFTCEGRARLDTPEKELEFADFIANLPNEVVPET